VDDREELIRWLLEEGFTREEIERSVTPIYLPAARAVGDDGTRLTADEAVTRSGLSIDQLKAFARAAGIPALDDPAAPSQIAADVDVVARAKEFLELGLSEEQVLAVTRVMSHGLSQTAEVMRQAVLDAVLRPGTTELQLAQSYGAVVELLAPKIGPLVHDLLLVQLRHSLETEAINASERAAGRLPGARDVGVAFADIVGFTQLGETLEPAQLEEVAQQLADRARTVAQAPVRFIKTIGDAVMLVSPNVDALVESMLALSDEQLRIGIAYGPAVSRAGDWFGASVNLASRVTAVARPGSVLVAEAARGQLAERGVFRWSFAGPHRMKNVRDEVNLFRARASKL